MCRFTTVFSSTAKLWNAELMYSVLESLKLNLHPSSNPPLTCTLDDVLLLSILFKKFTLNFIGTWFIVISSESDANWLRRDLHYHLTRKIIPNRIEKSCQEVIWIISELNVAPTWNPFLRINIGQNRFIWIYLWFLASLGFMKMYLIRYNHIHNIA